MRKNHCNTRKNTIRYNHFIQEHTPRISLEMINSSKNLLFGLKIIIWLCVSFSSDKLLASNNCCKTHHQPNFFTHSLTNLLYWAYWAHILFYLGLGYDLWPYSYTNLIKHFVYQSWLKKKTNTNNDINPNISKNNSFNLFPKKKSFNKFPGFFCLGII